MAQTSRRQRKTTGRVMHEYKHGELKRSRGGRGGKVRSRRQAIAIALREAGASKYESKAKNRRNLAKTKRKEARGKTAQQEREGKSHVGAHVGARGRSESSTTQQRKRRTRTTRGRTSQTRTTRASSRGRQASSHRKATSHKASTRAHNGRRSRRRKRA